VAADAALMVGDSANDAEAARAAGMPVLLVTYGYSEACRWTASNATGYYRASSKCSAYRRLTQIADHPS
jgi:phosphoglycolate phosphatase-like HAD superfamily hydrolase